MRTVVWTSQRTDEVLALLHARAARRRRLVPTPSGTCLLGPGDLRSLVDTLLVTTTGARSAVGFAWTETTAWLVVRTGRGVTGARFGPERLAGPEFADGELPDVTAAQIASVLGVTAEEVHNVVATTSGDGLPRLRLLLDRLGFTPEARVLDWVDEAGPDVVPAHTRRWPDALFGELRQPRNTPVEPQRGMALLVLNVVWIAISVAIGLLALPFFQQLFPWPWNVVVLLVAIAGILHVLSYNLPNGVLMIVRRKRHDPFPVSDPLRVHQRPPHLETGIVDG